jgi:type I restriction enzyme M protein
LATLGSTTPQQLARIVSFIWGIADDVLRDLYVRGKYRDVILPMTVLRRFDAVLEMQLNSYSRAHACKGVADLKQMPLSAGTFVGEALEPDTLELACRRVTRKAGQELL